MLTLQVPGHQVICLDAQLAVDTREIQQVVEDDVGVFVALADCNYAGFGETVEPASVGTVYDSEAKLSPRGRLDRLRRLRLRGRSDGPIIKLELGQLVGGSPCNLCQRGRIGGLETQMRQAVVEGRSEFQFLWRPSKLAVVRDDKVFIDFDFAVQSRDVEMAQHEIRLRSGGANRQSPTVDVK